MTLLLIDPKNTVSPSDRTPPLQTTRSDAVVADLDGSYRALQTAYGEAAALSTTADQQDHWRTQSQRLRHLRLRIQDDDLYLVVTATSALKAERQQVEAAIEGLIANRS